MPLDTRTYTSGSGTDTIPAGATQLVIKAWGGGAGGGRSNLGGGGGGGGAYVLKTITSGLTEGLTFSYSVGAAGAGSSSTAVEGGDGAASTVTNGTYGTTVNISAGGGDGGGTGTAAGTGGVASGGDTNTNGADGQAGGDNIGGAGGDAGATYTGGGTSAFSGGAGGGGGANGSASTGTTGGNGGAGRIIFEYTTTTAYTITAALGTFTLTGRAATLTRGLVPLIAEVGEFEVSAIEADFPYPYRYALRASPGQFFLDVQSDVYNVANIDISDNVINTVVGSVSDPVTGPIFFRRKIRTGVRCQGGMTYNAITDGFED